MRDNDLEKNTTALSDTEISGLVGNFNYIMQNRFFIALKIRLKDNNGSSSG